MELGALRFEECYMPRIWGGRKLESLYDKRLPANDAIGEAWLIADHTVHESVVSEGPHRGRTLHELVVECPRALLGRLASPTPFGRFPLLLKLLDACEVLSVQVHPDDACAKRLGEPDIGKTEMWYVLNVEPGSELICGLDPAVTPPLFEEAIVNGSIARQLGRYPVQNGSALFVPAGTVHALAAGVMVAEIQQNSDLTYRLYDWERTDAAGKPRSLHVEKAMHAIHFGEHHAGPAILGVGNGVWKFANCSSAGNEHILLAASPFFAADRVTLDGTAERDTHGDSFHIILVEEGPLDVQGTRLQAGEAALVPAEHPNVNVSGKGAFLDYYVPDTERDIRRPLLHAGPSRP